MRNIFLVTTRIDVDLGEQKFQHINDDGILIKRPRSFFTSEERLRQTIYTVFCIKNSHPDDDIVVIDSSRNAEKYKPYFDLFSNVEFVALKDISESACELTYNNINAGVGCRAIISAYSKHNLSKLKDYDFIVNVVGRYGFYGLDDKLFVPENKNKLVVQKRTSENKLTQFANVSEFLTDYLYRGTNIDPLMYNTQLYFFGIDFLDRMIDIYDATVYLLNHPKLARHCFCEDLLYYLTRSYSDDVVETSDWFVYGWSGRTGFHIYG